MQAGLLRSNEVPPSSTGKVNQVTFKKKEKKKPTVKSKLKQSRTALLNLGSVHARPLWGGREDVKGYNNIKNFWVRKRRHLAQKVRPNLKSLTDPSCFDSMFIQESSSFNFLM